MNAMDSGWAVIVGAVIALAGALVTPLILEPRRERAARTREARDELARLIPEVVRYAMGHKQDVDGRQVELMTRIRFLVPKSDDAIVQILGSAITVPREQRSPAIANATSVIARWLDGTYTSKRALLTYNIARLADPDGKIATDFANEATPPKPNPEPAPPEQTAQS